MSSVYAAVHRNGRRVAIKVLSSELSQNARVRGRFLREGYIANRVGHDGAVAVLDDDRDGELFFLVMELLEGETLARRAHRLGERLPAEEAAYAAEGLLDVLVAAHGNGIVHRDVKPENVFLTMTGQVKLLDFGIASLRETSLALRHSRSGGALGTPGFMAPEQARGRWEEVDARTDVWAVGATLFRLLTGRLVHDRGTANEAMIASATVPAPSLGQARPELPAALIALVDRALALEPGQRWQSAAEMRARIRALRAQLPVFRWQPPPVRDPAEVGTLDQTDSQVSGSLPGAADRGASSGQETAPLLALPVAPAAPRRRLSWWAAAAVVGLVAGAGLALRRRPIASPVTAPPAAPISAEPARVTPAVPAEVAPDSRRELPVPAEASPRAASKPAAPTKTRPRPRTRQRSEPAPSAFAAPLPLPVEKSPGAPANKAPPPAAPARNLLDERK
jgi:serine/threonine-protein kinase